MNLITINIRTKLYGGEVFPTLIHFQHCQKLIFQCLSSIMFSSVQSLSRVWLFATPWTAARPPYPSPTPRVYSNSCPVSWWRHLTISSSVIPFSSCLQSFPTSGSFQICQLFAPGGQNIGVSAATLPCTTLLFHLPKKYT